MELSVLYKIFLAHPVITTDSRDCPPESIFFALKGDSFNGNRFAQKALESGCAYAVVDEAAFANPQEPRLILVDDCLQTLQQLANYHRRQLGTHLIGITGTNGKTTTKELIATVLSKKYKVLYTQGNFNNHIGVPKTLLRLTADYDFGVIEMGANHPGEIDTLVHIVEPNDGIITNVGKAHLQGFGSFEGVIKTKGELYDFLRTRPDNRVFIHKDNTHLRGIATGLKLTSYGSPSDGFDGVNGEVMTCAPYLCFRWRIGEGEWHCVQTHLIGSYNIDNMLAAAAIGTYYGVEPQQIDEALGGYIPQNNRSQLMHTEKNHLIVDAYNANPTSMMAALKSFRDLKAAPKFAILGDMRELGEGSMAEHQKIVDFIDACHFEQVWLVGAEFGKLNTSYTQLPDVEALKAKIKEVNPQGYYLLLKGSNSIRLSEVIPYL